MSWNRATASECRWTGGSAEAENDPYRQGETGEQNSDCLIDVSGLPSFHLSSPDFQLRDGPKDTLESQVHLIIGRICGQGIAHLLFEFCDELRGWIGSGKAASYENVQQSRRVEHRHRAPSPMRTI